MTRSAYGAMCAGRQPQTPGSDKPPLNTPSTSKGAETSRPDQADAVLRLAAIALRRFTRDPETRASSSLNLLRYAIRLHADQTSAGDAALAAGEAVGELAREARLDARKAKGGA